MPIYQYIVCMYIYIYMYLYAHICIYTYTDVNSQIPDFGCFSRTVSEFHDSKDLCMAETGRCVWQSFRRGNVFPWSLPRAYNSDRFIHRAASAPLYRFFSPSFDPSAPLAQSRVNLFDRGIAREKWRPSFCIFREKLRRPETTMGGS